MSASSIRVLLASDTFSQVGLVLHFLRSRSAQNLEWFHVSAPTALGNTIREIRPHLILIQLSMFQSEPYASVRLLHCLFPHIPLILFANPADKDIAAKCLRLGAYDYMLEGHMDEHTLQRVFQSALTAPSSRPPSPSSREPLTGTPARDSSSSAPADAPPMPLGLGAGQFSVSVILENFSQLEEQLGAQHARDLLERLIPVLRGVIRATDRLIHSAPGHFVVVASDANDACLPSLRFRIASSLAAWRDARPGHPPLNLSFLPGVPAAADRMQEARSPRSVRAAAGV